MHKFQELIYNVHNIRNIHLAYLILYESHKYWPLINIVFVYVMSGNKFP